jgi:ATP/maltotriose-dependent transcriptional regulator MalT
LISVRSGQSAEAGPLMSVAPLVDRSEDPMARSSFLNSCAIALTTNARYREAEAVATRFHAEAEDYRLRFVLPYAELRLASIAAGQRRFADAFAALERAEASGARASDKWLSATAPAIRALVLLSAGEPARALAEAQVTTEASASIRAEMLAVRALALACSGEHSASLAAADEARRTSVTLEASSFAQMADAVAACVAGDGETARRASTAAFEFACKRATIDHFVTAYRAFPPILDPIADEGNSRLGKVLVDAGDADVAARLGLCPEGRRDALSAALSPREREVFDLMASGSTNKQIAQALYISESTAKVHVRHIFEKLGANTRTEAVARGKERLERR